MKTLSFYAALSIVVLSSVPAGAADLTPDPKPTPDRAALATSSKVGITELLTKAQALFYREDHDGALKYLNEYFE